MIDFRCIISTFSGGYRRICQHQQHSSSILKKTISPQNIVFYKYFSTSKTTSKSKELPLLNPRKKKVISSCFMHQKEWNNSNNDNDRMQVRTGLMYGSSSSSLNNVKFFSSGGDGESSTKSKQLVTPIKNPYEGLTLGEKVKEASKDVTYLGVIVVGIGITAFMFYAIGCELLSQQSPNAIFGKAFKKCKNDEEVQNVLGEPIKAYGEESSRRRRRHVNHVEYDVGGVKHMRMKFYIEGQHRKATVNLEMKQNEKGKYEYRYLFVQMDSYPHQIIVLEDNR